MTMTTITRSYELQCAHSLPHVDQETHKCARKHGHTWLIELTVGGVVDPVMGWAMDFGEVDAIWQEHVHDVIDHRDLNDVLENPTTELLCAWIADRLKDHLPGLTIVSARENRRSCVTLTL